MSRRPPADRLVGFHARPDLTPRCPNGSIACHKAAEDKEPQTKFHPGNKKIKFLVSEVNRTTFEKVYCSGAYPTSERARPC
jgi:hypothetical protein